MRFVDLSHVIEHGMTTYPGLPAPEIGTHLAFDESHGSYADGTEFQIGRISTGDQHGHLPGHPRTPLAGGTRSGRG